MSINSMTVAQYHGFVARGQFGRVSQPLETPFALVESRVVLDDAGNETGCVHDTARATVGKILADIGVALKKGDAIGPFEGVDYCTLGPAYNNFHNDRKPYDEPFPDYRWIACYYVTGGSEAHYVHVDVIGDKGERKMVYLIKTFGGRDEAARIADLLARNLEA